MRWLVFFLVLLGLLQGLVFPVSAQTSLQACYQTAEAVKDCVAAGILKSSALVEYQPAPVAVQEVGQLTLRSVSDGAVKQVSGAAAAAGFTAISAVGVSAIVLSSSQNSQLATNASTVSNSSTFYGYYKYLTLYGSYGYVNCNSGCTSKDMDWNGVPASYIQPHGVAAVRGSLELVPEQTQITPETVSRTLDQPGSLNYHFFNSLQVTNNNSSVSNVLTDNPPDKYWQIVPSLYPGQILVISKNDLPTSVLNDSRLVVSVELPDSTLVIRNKSNEVVLVETKVQTNGRFGAPTDTDTDDDRTDRDPTCPSCKYRQENFALYFFDKLASKFPLDILLDLPSNHEVYPVPTFTVFGRTIEIPFLKELFLFLPNVAAIFWSYHLIREVFN